MLYLPVLGAIGLNGKGGVILRKYFYIAAKNKYKGNTGK